MKLYREVKALPTVLVPGSFEVKKGDGYIMRLEPIEITNELKEVLYNKFMQLLPPSEHKVILAEEYSDDVLEAILFKLQNG